MATKPPRRLKWKGWKLLKQSKQKTKNCTKGNRTFKNNQLQNNQNKNKPIFQANPDLCQCKLDISSCEGVETIQISNLILSLFSWKLRLMGMKRMILMMIWRMLMMRMRRNIKMRRIVTKSWKPLLKFLRLSLQTREDNASGNKKHLLKTYSIHDDVWLYDDPMYPNICIFISYMIMYAN